MSTDQPGAPEGGRSHHLSMDCTGKLARRPGTAGLTGACSVEGIVSVHTNFCSVSSLSFITYRQ